MILLETARGIRLVWMLMLLIVVGYAHSQTAPSLDMIMQRLEATESELKSYKTIVKQNTAAIETLKQQLEKCSCEQLDKRIETMVRRDGEGVNSAGLTDALSMITSHFRKQGIEVPGLTGETHGNKTLYSSGSVYTRWGRTVCDGDAQLIYKGFMAGSWYGVNAGGGVNYLCMPTDGPEYNKYNEAAKYTTKLSGAEYESHNYGIFPDDAHDKNIPCARCYTKESATMMLPAKRTCPYGWTKQYEGYIMSALDDVNHDRGMYECIDSEPEYIRGSHKDTDGVALYFVKTDCDGMGSTAHCPPYHTNRQLTCVVCTK